MPLFRLHRGSFSESIKTTILIKDIRELRAKIVQEHILYDGIAFGGVHDKLFKNCMDFNIKIEIPSYLTFEQSFDTRCGWFTHYVSADLFELGSFIIVGILSEPMRVEEEEKENKNKLILSVDNPLSEMI